MKNVVIQLSLLLGILFVTTSLSAQDLYLIIGQSNAAGRDTNIDTNGEDKLTSNVQHLTDDNNYTNDSRFLKARQPLNRYSSIGKSESLQGVNFGLEFGKEMYEYNGNKVHLVVNARGGTKIEAWRKGHSDGYFEEAVQRVKDGEAKCGCQLKGILWHQGEGNVKSSDGSYTSSYFTSLKSLINEFRDELGDVPFLVGQLYHQDKNDNFNRDIKKVDDSNFGLDNVDWVTARKLTTFDGTHFDAASTRLLGRRYAKIMKGYVSSNASRLANLDVELGTGFKVFPNPSSETIRVLGTEEAETFKIYNFSGAKVMETKTIDIDISALKPGIYIIITQQNKRLKFIKE